MNLPSTIMLATRSFRPKNKAAVDEMVLMEIVKNSPGAAEINIPGWLSGLIGGQ
jgi:hypothetical protein